MSLKGIMNEVLGSYTGSLYSTGNSAPCCVAAWMEGGWAENGYMFM